jgi:hypothetical protein
MLLELEVIILMSLLLVLSLPRNNRGAVERKLVMFTTIIVNILIINNGRRTAKSVSGKDLLSTVEDLHDSIQSPPQIFRRRIPTPTPIAIELLKAVATELLVMVMQRLLLEKLVGIMILSVALIIVKMLVAAAGAARDAAGTRGIVKVHLLFTITTTTTKARLTYLDATAGA